MIAAELVASKSEPVGSSDIDDGSLCLDRLKLDQSPLPHARADCLRPFPGFGTLQIRIPEGPGSALWRADGIDRAAARLTIEKCAVAVGKVSQRHSATHEFRMSDARFPDRLTTILSDGNEFFLSDPDNSGGSRAAVTAL